MGSDARPRLDLHATAFVFGEHGMLLRGASGAGKSTLTLELIGMASAGRLIELVGDDRVRLEAVGGRLLISPHQVIGGLIELRHLGILPRPYEPKARLAGLIDIAESPPRLPGPDQLTIEFLGIRVYHRWLDIRSLSVHRLMLAVEDISSAMRR